MEMKHDFYVGQVNHWVNTPFGQDSVPTTKQFSLLLNSDSYTDNSYR